MAPNLGKRKRITREELEQPSRSPSPTSESAGSDSEDMRDIFQRAFEAKFRPLEVERKKPKVEEVVESDEEEQEEEDWSGISSAEEDKVEVFEYTDKRSANDRASKAELRAFMVPIPSPPFAFNSLNEIVLVCETTLLHYTHPPLQPQQENQRHRRRHGSLPLKK